MPRLLLGVLIGMALSAPSVWALRVARPPEFYEWNTNTMTQLNDVLLGFFNVVNGRYTHDVVTSDPDGTRNGDAGQGVLWMNGATATWCMNTASTTDWDCVGLTD